MLFKISVFAQKQPAAACCCSSCPRSAKQFKIKIEVETKHNTSENRQGQNEDIEGFEGNFFQFNHGFVNLKSMFNMISALCLLSAYFTSEKLTTTTYLWRKSLDCLSSFVQEFILCLRPLASSRLCSTSRLQTEYAFVYDKWVTFHSQTLLHNSILKYTFFAVI